MQALILAGGLGTRLRSIVNDRPKPMAQLGDKPFLEHQVELLKGYGISELIFCVGYRHQQIQDYFGDGAHWGVRITYSVEEMPLGTAGALKQAEAQVHGAFLALNGDSVFEFNLADLLETHTRRRRQEGAAYLGTVALTRVDDPRDYGLVKLDSQQHIVSFSEKSSERPALDDQSKQGNYINAGIYVLEPALLNFVPTQQAVSIERETFPSLLAQGYRLGGYPAQGFFVDIGTPAGYYRLQHRLQEVNV